MKTPANRLPLQLKPYSTKDLAEIYGVAKRTFRKWIAPFHSEIGNKNGRYYTIAQVKIIFFKLGLPGPANEH
jgi:hypothetical protein